MHTLMAPEMLRLHSELLGLHSEFSSFQCRNTLKSSRVTCHLNDWVCILKRINICSVMLIIKMKETIAGNSYH